MIINAKCFINPYSGGIFVRSSPGSTGPTTEHYRLQSADIINNRRVKYTVQTADGVTRKPIAGCWIARSLQPKPFQQFCGPILRSFCVRVEIVLSYANRRSAVRGPLSLLRCRLSGRRRGGGDDIRRATTRATGRLLRHGTLESGRRRYCTAKRNKSFSSLARTRAGR